MDILVNFEKFPNLVLVLCRGAYNKNANKILTSPVTMIFFHFPVRLNMYFLHINYELGKCL